MFPQKGAVFATHVSIMAKRSSIEIWEDNDKVVGPAQHYALLYGRHKDAFFHT